MLSDLAVCADLAMATVRCAIYNVRVNLPSVTDAADRQKIESTVSQMLSRAAAAIQRSRPNLPAKFHKTPTDSRGLSRDLAPWAARVNRGYPHVWPAGQDPPASAMIRA